MPRPRGAGNGPIRVSRRSASTAATLQSKLNKEPSILTDAERLLMKQWLSNLADAPQV